MKLIDILVEELPKRGGWPEGSTRCMQTDGLYVTFPDIGDHCDFVAKCMAEGVRIATREQYEAALAASKPEWDGEGLPPVGCECEWQDKNTKAWLPVVIAYSSEWVTVVRELRPLKVGDAVECCINNFGEEERLQFRPIRSEADKRKEAAVFAIAELCRNSASNGHSAELIYDAIKSGKIVID